MQLLVSHVASTYAWRVIRYVSYPRTQPPPEFISAVVEVFQIHEAVMNTKALEKGLTSDAALAVVREDLVALGFSIEQSKVRAGKIRRPVYFGENGVPSLAYEIDGFHGGWRCGIEIEAGRGWMGNAVYRDLVQALVMVNVEHLVLAVANSYKYLSSGRPTFSRDYENTIAVADALYGHSRITMPYGLTVIGY